MSFSFERNGIRTILNPQAMMRIGLTLYLIFGFWQAWRVPIWGQIEEREHHAYNFDHIIYDKLSTRNTPHHHIGGFP